MWEVWKCWGNHCKFWESFNNKCWTQQTSKKIFIDTDILNKLWQVGKCCWFWSQAINKNTHLTAPVVNIISPTIVHIQYLKNLDMIITKCRCFSLLEDKKNKFSTPRRSWRWRRTVCGRCRPLSPPPDLGSELPLWETHFMCLVRLLSTFGVGWFYILSHLWLLVLDIDGNALCNYVTKFFAQLFKSQKMLINVYLTLSIAGGDLTAKLNNPITNILRYEASNETWLEAGHMQAGRILHAVAVMEDISHLCPWCEADYWGYWGHGTSEAFLWFLI